MCFCGGANGPYRQGDYGDPDDSAADRHPPEDFGNALRPESCWIEGGLRTGAGRKRGHARQEDMSAGGATHARAPVVAAVKIDIRVPSNQRNSRQS